MTIGLAVAAIVLIAAVVFFAMSDKKPASDDPAKVNVGSEQRDYDVGSKDTAPPSAETSAAAPTPEPPKPKPIVVPKTTPKPTPPRPDPADPDIYD